MRSYRDLGLKLAVKFEIRMFRVGYIQTWIFSTEELTCLTKYILLMLTL